MYVNFIISKALLLEKGVFGFCFLFLFYVSLYEQALDKQQHGADVFREVSRPLS